MKPLKPLIFVTNDDGVISKGIASLFEVAKEFGDVVVVAPNSPQSGMGHAITLNEPLRLEKVNLFGDIPAYSCSGTPVDCVKLGIYEVMKRKPDLVLSGINHGANTATNVLYSGTMSATIEGAMEGINSIGFSLCDFGSDANFDVAKDVARQLIKKVLAEGLDEGVCLNVNVPKVDLKDHKGIKVCRQASAYWEDSFDKRLDQFERPYYWLTGEFKDFKQEEDTDLYWIEKNYTTVVPTMFDLTAHKVISKLKNWEE